MMENSAEKGTLPDGWVVKYSKKYKDRVYYFNVFTGCATWECPVLDPPKEPKIRSSKFASIFHELATNDFETDYKQKDLKVARSKISSPVVNQPYSKLSNTASSSSKTIKRSLGNDISRSETTVRKTSNPLIAVLSSKNKIKGSLGDSISSTETLEKKTTNSIISVASSLNKRMKRPLENDSSGETPVRKTADQLITVASCSRKEMKCLLENDKVLSGESSVKEISKSSNPPTAVVAPVRFEIKKRVIAVPVRQQTQTTLSNVSASSITKRKKKKKKKKKPSELENSLLSILEPQNKISSEEKQITVSPANKEIVSVRNVSVSSLSSLSRNSKNNKVVTITLSDVQPSSIPPSKSSASSSNNVEKFLNLSNENELPENHARRSSSGGSTEKVPNNSLSNIKDYVSDDELSEDMDFEVSAEWERTSVLSTSLETNEASTTLNSEFDSLDIEMLDVSSELCKTDDIGNTSRIEGAVLESYYIVVDTNAWISDLKYIDEIKDTPVNRCGPPHIFIPWVVLQELDNLKKHGKYGKHNNSTKLAAIEAIRYVFNILKAKHPRFHSQRPDEVNDDHNEYGNTNDDKILNCCVKLQSKIPQEKVILMTNDRNLSNKAMICNVQVHDWSSLKVALKPDVYIKENLPKKKALQNAKSDAFKALGQLKESELKVQKDHKNCISRIDFHMTKARQFLKEVLDPIFEKEMDEAYGTAWHFFPVERHSLKGILNGFIKYWRLVFEFKLSNEDKCNFELLQAKVNRAEGFLGDRIECINVLSSIENVFKVVNKKWSPKYVPFEEVNQIKASVEKSFAELSDLKKSLTEIESSIAEMESGCVLEVFDHNWTVINHLCGSALDFCNIPHNIVYAKVEPLPPKSVFLRVVPELHRSLQQIKESMINAMELVKSNKINGKLFKTLFKNLLSLVPSLQIETEIPDFYNFSPKMLERFFRSPDNKERIESGFLQLVNYLTKLHQALHALLS